MLWSALVPMFPSLATISQIPTTTLGSSVPNPHWLWTILTFSPSPSTQCSLITSVGVCGSKWTLVSSTRLQLGRFGGRCTPLQWYFFSNTYHTLSFHCSIQRAVLCSLHCSGEAVCGMENTLAWTKKSTAQLCVSTQPWGSPLLSWSLYTSGWGRVAMPCRQGSFAQSLFESSYHINKH